ncbi:hypothetical protein BG261_01030 [Floricoccus tropicus]|uniref:HTH LytTR-type domain-containing protein n=1 Tax=Floricoccus tropicus TaxID=1859473 RepID=A0A1E8GSB2_9LACT|nr:LytTR family DNA-binding domain-containing protein [Floricoccus tropicus]OFI50493.1 hypothetical protein BG261_01030 [Floricoccus tropicus]
MSNQNVKDNSDMMFISTKFKDIYVPLDEILYFETSPQPHRLILNTSTDQFEFYGRLSEIEEKYDQLIRSHKSFLVNLSNAIELNKSNLSIKFINGCECYVSRRKIKKIQSVISRN